MRSIVVNNQKGGVGKTMLAVHLAWFLAEEHGARVLFIDLDPQGNASYTLAGERVGGSSSAGNAGSQPARSSERMLMANCTGSTSARLRLRMDASCSATS